MAARRKTLDFAKIKETQQFRNGREKSLSKKQLRARARRKAAKGKPIDNELALLHKPVDQWDAEELARGRPKAKDGTFSGRPPQWVSREVYEQAMTRFQQLTRERVQEQAAGAIPIVKMLLESKELDDKGKPVVPASVKLDAAKWLIEHVIGKPTQRVEQDISVKLQAVLAQATFDGGDVHPAWQGPPQKVIDSAPDTFEDYAEEVDDDDDVE